MKQLRIHVSCPDDRGLLAAVAGRIFELGGDLGDATFALLGEEADFTCVCAVPDALSEDELERALAALPALEKADVSVRAFRLGYAHAQHGRATHVVQMRGQDRPGLLARLAEGFSDLGANVVRFDAEHEDLAEGREYAMRFEVWVPKGREEAVLANAANTAETLGLRFASSVATRD
ncbi:MAG: amino acid-binding protein [Sandaracinaceae bacterium]|nr:amino acid-binding protein [Sandaracinaceae bacterium]